MGENICIFGRTSKTELHYNKFSLVTNLISLSKHCIIHKTRKRNLPMSEKNPVVLQTSRHPKKHRIFEKFQGFIAKK